MMARGRRRGAMGWLLLLAAAALAIPSFPIAQAEPSVGATSGGGAALTALPGAVLPSALQASWAARSGFGSIPAGQVAGGRVATGDVGVTVTLWPSSSGLFAPVPSGTRPLTATQVGDVYGQPPASYNALAGYFRSEGLTITHTWPDRLAIGVSGPAASIDAAFGTTLLSGLWHGHSVRYPASVPRLPAPYAAEVAAVSGLSDGFSQFSIPFAPVSHASVGPAPSAIRTSTLVTPASVHQIYGLNGLYNYSGSPHWATGQTIALVLWGEGYDPSDIQAFYGMYYPAGFPAITVQGFPVDGAPAPSANAVNDPSGAAQELTLDLEWSGSEAPGATLDAFYAPDGPASNSYSPSDQSMEDTISSAINTAGVNVLSMSFGTPDGNDPSFQAALSISFGSAAQRGITVLAASGDNGGSAQTNCQGGPSPQFPAASPQVLAVGGTAPVLALDTVGSVTGLASEPAWNLSGGGFSTDYSDPTWQDVGSAGTAIAPTGHRGIPDVAGPAADNFFYFGGNQAAGKGTSFATPMWAGIIAEMNAVRGTPFGFLTPRLYRVGVSEAAGTAAQGLADVTQGANCIGPATTGWDPSTGWGSPRGLLLYQDLLYSFVQLNLTIASTTVVPGSSIDATVVVLNASSHRPIPNLVVDYSLTSIGSVGLCSGTLASGNSSTDPSGTSVLSLTVPGCYLGSHIGLTAVVSSQGYFGSNSTSITVNLLGLASFLSVIQVYPYNIIAFISIMAIATTLGLILGRPQGRLAVGAARRRADSRPASRPSPPAPPPSDPGTPAVAPPPAEPGPPPPLPEPMPTVPSHVEAAPAGSEEVVPPAGADGPVGTAGAEVPAHVAEPPEAEPPEAPPSEAPPEEPAGHACRICAGTIPAGAESCPSCGAVA